jgi:hypothetical protein
MKSGILRISKVKLNWLPKRPPPPPLSHTHTHYCCILSTLMSYRALHTTSVIWILIQSPCRVGKFDLVQWNLQIWYFAGRNILYDLYFVADLYLERQLESLWNQCFIQRNQDDRRKKIETLTFEGLPTTIDIVWFSPNSHPFRALFREGMWNLMELVLRFGSV